MQETIDRLVDVRRALKGLALSDKDLNGGLAIAKISHVRACVKRLIDGD
jgi:hypothetical protein